MTALALRGSRIRYLEDTPTTIPALQTALNIFSQRPQDPYVFQALIYFFSSLLPYTRRHISSTIVFQLWNSCRAQLKSPYHYIFHDAEACRQTESIIDQLLPLSTFRELEGIANAYTKGDPTSRSGINEDDLTFVNRGHDWIIRCAYELCIPATWKSWLVLMYEKQPYKVLDLPCHCFDDSGSLIFLSTVAGAAQLDGFNMMIPLIKFWLRQATTLVQVWDVRLTVDGNDHGIMPPYAWCVAAYEKMWHRFKNDLRDPFSAYPYMLRHSLLQNLSYMQIFEECWGWVCLATQNEVAEDFDALEVQKVIYKRVLTLVQNDNQPRNFSTGRMLKEAFSQDTPDGGHQLRIEEPIVQVHNLEDDLREHKSLNDGLCSNFYNLPDTTPEELDALYPETETDSDSDEDIEMGELELIEDVELEAYGPLIDIAQFTSVKQPGPGDFCTWCQDEISLDDSDEKCCVVPVSCSDTFHAGCLKAWVNSVSENSNQCPNCKVQMTTQQRASRMVK